MTDNYKGFEFPEIMSDDKAHYIISDEGIFDGYSEADVLLKWKLRVDSMYNLQALEEGYHEISLGIWGCPDCGLITWDIYRHKNFHQDLTN